LAAFGQTATNNMMTVIRDFATFLTKAVPDTKLTLKKYADAKFEYLVSCIVVPLIVNFPFWYRLLVAVILLEN
jgi:hypothetical protein